MANTMRIVGASLCVVFAVFASSIAYATPQGKDKLWYGGHEYPMFQVPMLGLWYYGNGEPPPGKSRPPALEFTSTGNWKGYSAVWKIEKNQLLLRTIRGRINGKDVENEVILAGAVFPVVATWFTGNVYLPVGDFNEKNQEYEAVIVFKVDKGDIKSMSFIQSGKISTTWNGS